MLNEKRWYKYVTPTSSLQPSSLSFSYNQNYRRIPHQSPHRAVVLFSIKIQEEQTVFIHDVCISTVLHSSSSPFLLHVLWDCTTVVVLKPLIWGKKRRWKNFEQLLPWQQASCTQLVQRCHSNSYTPKCTVTATANTGAAFHTDPSFSGFVTAVVSALIE